jgi:DNA polymerase
MAPAKRDDGRGAEPFVPRTRSLPALREAAQGCRGCDLYKHGTQAVFGEGPRDAVLMFVGEVPGDVEDKAGHPFVGPAGRLLDKALAEVGIERKHVFVTNAVKHFKFTPRGKRRIHSKPSAREIRACRPWLDAELAAVHPQMVVALGATAAQALFGPMFRVTHERGRSVETPIAPWAMATVHPSSLLRAPETQDREAAWRAFIADLAVAAKQYRKIVGKKPQA